MPKTKQQNRRNKLFANLLQTGENYLSEAKRWIINNPLKSLTIFLALTSVPIPIVRLMRNQPINSTGNPISDELGNLPLQANIHTDKSGDFDELAGFVNLPLFKCWFDLEFKNYLSEIQTDIQEIEVEDSLKCPTVIFYEAHNDKIAVNTITNLLSYFIDSGYKTFIFEWTTGTSIDESIQKHEEYANHYYEQERYAIIANLPQRAREMAAYSETYTAKTVLLKRIQELKLNYGTIDLDQQTYNQMEKRGLLWLKKMGYGQARWTDQEYKQRLLNETLETRDDYMAKRIRSICAKHGTGQIVLVGRMHNGIEDRLRDVGYSNTSSFYIINNPNINATEAVISTLHKKNSPA